MKFTCERCSAQYMISDEKVGASGVKVRCKKCGNVIHVRRNEAGAADAPAPAAGGGAPGAGLEAELGQAFDTAFGDGAPLDATQAMSPEDAAKIAAAPEPPAGEWYVAIGQAQVGPLPIAEVRKKWEAGDIGPDSLVWKPGMGDWCALSSVQDLSAYLAPISRAPSRASRPAMEAVRDAAPRYGTASAMQAVKDPAAGTPARGVPAAAPAADPAWKPAGASALAALASEEIAARNAPEPARSAPSAKPAGSLVDAMNLPDGGVDPTGAIPLAIKGMEKTGERKVSSLAASAAKQRRSRGVLVGVIVTLLVVVGGATAPAPAPQPPAPAPAPAAAPPAVAVAEPAPVTPPPAPPAAEPAKAEPVKPAPVAAAAPPPEPKKTSKPSRPSPKREPDRVAAAPVQPAPAPKKSGGVLDFDENDAALNEALGASKTPSGRSVYVPPATAAPAAASLPREVSTAQIQESVAGRVDALRRCVQEQKAREPDATGVLKMAWTITGEGVPTNVRCVTPEYASGQFAACLGGVIRNVRFPKSQTTGQPVTFPFSF